MNKSFSILTNDFTVALRGVNLPNICLMLYLCVTFGHQLENDFDSALRYGSFILYVAIALVFNVLPSMRSTDNKKLITVYTVWLLAFWAYAYLSWFWAVYPDYLLAKRAYHSRVVQVLFVITLVCFQIRRKEDVLALLNILLIANLYSIVLLVLNTPTYMWGTERVGMGIGVDKNLVGMRTAFAMFISFFLFLDTKKWRYLAMMASCLMVSGMTGSRKAAIIIVLAVALYLTFSARGGKAVRNAIVAFVIVAGLYMAVMNTPELYNVMGSRIENLIESFVGEGEATDFSARERSWFRNYAMMMWLEHPVIGWGFVGFEAQMSAINYSNVAYSHCNYTELLTTLGVVGLVLYYGFYVYLLLRLFALKPRENSYVLFAFILLIILVVIEYGLVSFVDVDVFFYLLIIYCIAEIYSPCDAGKAESRTHV